ncbi:unnamed protein product, partial [Prorocentrum cordatum]
MPCNGPACGGIYCGSCAAVTGICALSTIGVITELITSFEDWTRRIEGAVEASCDVNMYTPQQTLLFDSDGTCSRTEMCNWQSTDMNEGWNGEGYWCTYRGFESGGYKYRCPCEVVESGRLGEATWFVVYPTTATGGDYLPTSPG